MKILKLLLSIFIHTFYCALQSYLLCFYNVLSISKFDTYSVLSLFYSRSAPLIFEKFVPILLRGSNLTYPDSFQGSQA